MDPIVYSTQCNSGRMIYFRENSIILDLIRRIEKRIEMEEKTLKKNECLVTWTIIDNRIGCPEMQSTKRLKREQ